MEKKEENYIRQLLLELDEYLFSLRWYDKEDREIMLKNIIGFDSIFQIIPKRFHKLLEGRIYTQEELDKAREEGKRDATEKLRLAFHEVFFKSGELWFDYLFEDGDIEAEQDAREIVEGYWEEVVSKLNNK